MRTPAHEEMPERGIRQHGSRRSRDIDDGPSCIIDWDAPDAIRPSLALIFFSKKRGSVDKNRRFVSPRARMRPPDCASAGISPGRIFQNEVSHSILFAYRPFLSMTSRFREKTRGGVAGRMADSPTASSSRRTIERRYRRHGQSRETSHPRSQRAQGRETSHFRRQRALVRSPLPVPSPTMRPRAEGSSCDRKARPNRMPRAPCPP